MPVEPGAQLGPYRILAPLGAGGMGEVFKARDVRLERDVALKVLPARLASDPDALVRFEREVKAVAALSHPNILAIHDFGQAEGRHYAVMELLEGETLRQLLDGGPLPAAKAIEYGRQIAEGLAAAHGRGIVHRDLKPENLFVTRDGHLKILDFGLARQTLAPTGDETSAPTMAARTEPGTLLGTVGYMAPEQVRGEAADARADIFALGCVLYEMATGRRAFARATAAETMTAILREEPPETPSESGARSLALDNLVRHCLEKRPEDRFQSARDLAFALRSLAGRSLADSWTSGEHAGTAPASPSRRRHAVTAGALALTAIALFLAGRYTGRGGGPAAAPHVASFVQVTDQPGVETTPSISPDGKSVVYARTEGTNTDLYLVRIGARNAVNLTPDSPRDDMQPAFSPDGERIAFRSDRDGGGIFLMTASGESVTRLTDFGYSPSWSPDGAEIAVSPSQFTLPTSLFSNESGLKVVNVKSGQIRALPVGPRGLQPSWSPHGARIAFWAVPLAGGQRDIWTIAADGSDVAGGGVPVTNDTPVDWSPTWSPDGRFLYFSSTRGGTMNLWRVAIDERSGRLLGAPETITAPSTWSGHLSFSRDGSRVAFASLDYRSTLLRVPFDAAREALTAPPVPVLKGTRPIRDHEVSPDGEWVAFTTGGVREDLFVARIDGTQYRRLTDDEFRDRGPAWSPDGARIAFYSDRSGVYDLWTIRPDGSGLSELTRGSEIAGFPVWSPDGRRVAFGFGSWALVDAGRPSAAPLALEANISAREWFMPTSWSPDGARIAGQIRDPSGAIFGVGLYSLPTKQFARVPGEFATEARWIVPAWLADGRRLVVRRPHGIGLVDSQTGAGRLLIPVGGEMVGRSVGVSRDNRWITYTETGTEGDIWAATLEP